MGDFGAVPRVGKIVWADDFVRDSKERKTTFDVKFRLPSWDDAIDQLRIADGSNNFRGTTIYDRNVYGFQQMIACCVSPENHG